MSKTPAPGLQMPAGLSLPEKVIEHITVTDQALQKAAAMEKTAAAKQAQVNALIPQVVDTMVKFERIGPLEREKLAAMLADPVKVLELMIKVAGHRNKDELSRLGEPMQKTAGASGNGSTGRAYNPADSLTDPNVGARTTRIKQSSVSLFRGLGLSVPTE